MRHIVLDTESTGLDPEQGHRMVEIGCVELHNFLPTGNNFWTYLNPETEMDAGAQAVHGLTLEFLADKPVFAQKAQEFIDFIGDSQLIIHNAPFDLKFLNYQLGALGYQPIPFERVIDTLPIARQTFPGQKNSLDALCQRFGIDNSGRNLHGALLDAQLLAEVYLELCGGRQPDLAIDITPRATEIISASPRSYKPPRQFVISAAEAAAHAQFVAGIKNNLWAEIFAREDELAQQAEVA